MRRSVVAVLYLVMSTGSVTAEQGLESQRAQDCAALAHAVTAQAANANAAFIRSYQRGQDESRLPAGLASTAFVYDNALAAIALVACGNLSDATVIGNALSSAVRNDRTFGDGRVRNAYRAGPVGGGLRRCRGGGTTSKKSGPKIRPRTALPRAMLHGPPWRC
jgi:hypothetical protein